MPPRSLRIAATVELVSLAVLLVNLATAHWAPLSSLIGPVHGCAYLFVLVLAFRSSPSPRVRLIAWIPGIGGALATWSRVWTVRSRWRA
ncbi:DUF3817 domain-containing protein [Umezawaea endophytica]|uniref:DUF3817 domain-containing protein n=1 Tax=Umezawaea endophytica TaxID=1654476 RepID=A0A9X2VL34_9PSEU|nr:DUF3817 domain-containing protein [Umezawaea endophytica]MCS7478638.1 DUF3817 domain-containing protein [Umezawaea endophytica]